MSRNEVLVPCLGSDRATPMLLVTYADAAVRVAFLLDGVRIEATVSRENWGRMVRGDSRPHEV